jgi:hypothetical protein
MAGVSYLIYTDHQIGNLRNKTDMCQPSYLLTASVGKAFVSYRVAMCLPSNSLHLNSL